MLTAYGVEVYLVYSLFCEILERIDRERLLDRVKDGCAVNVKLCEPRIIGRVREFSLVVEEEEVDRIWCLH